VPPLCISERILHLTIKPIIELITYVEMPCPSPIGWHYTWPVTGLPYSSPGTYYDPNPAIPPDCIKQRLNIVCINPTYTCDSFPWNGNIYTNTGVYTQTFVSSSGSDSLKVLNLVINHSTSSVFNQSQYSGPYTWPANGMTYSVSGIYTTSLINSSGCDSVLTLNLIIETCLFTLSLIEDQGISCYGTNDASLQASVIPSGTYTYTCVNPSNPPVTNTTGHFTMLETGTHTVYATDGNCITSQTITFIDPDPLDITFTTDQEVSCQGNDGALSVNITGGTNLIQGYLTWWTNAAGDTLNDGSTNPYALSLSNLPAGNYNVAIEDDHGCIYNETGTLNTAPPLTVSVSALPIQCYGGTSFATVFPSGGIPPYTYLWNNGATTATATNLLAGVYSVIVTDVTGCTSSTVLLMSQPSVIIGSSIVTVCDAYLWTINGNTYTTSGVYTSTSLNAAGCIHTDILDLTVYHSTSSNTVLTACNSYLWLANGMTYTTSGTYTHTMINAVGCDSLLSLQLTIVNGISLYAKAILGGAYDPMTGLMKDSLRRLTLYQGPQLGSPSVGAPTNVIPLTRINGNNGLSCANDADTSIGGGNSSSANAILSISGNNAIVDWVCVEVRNSSNFNIVLATKNALIQRDGDIVSCIDGVSPLNFNCLCPGNYYVSVKHRNHLGIMTANSMTLSMTPTMVDFTNPNPSTVWIKPGYPTTITNTPRHTIGSVAVMWGGDANSNKNSKYNGLANDKEVIGNDIGIGNINNSLYQVYKNTDLNMDGMVRYNNTDNDKNWLLNLIYSSFTPQTANAVPYAHVPN
jgi:SprB repeat